VVVKRKRNKPTFILIAAQAAVDAICCFFVPVVWFTCSDYVTRGDFRRMTICDSVMMVKMSMQVVSAYLIMTIAIERYMKLLYPLLRYEMNTWAAVGGAIIASLVVTAIGSVNSRGFEYFTQFTLTGCRKAFNHLSNYWPPFFANHYNFAVTVGLGYLLPLVITGFAYGRIILMLRERGKNVRHKSDPRAAEKEQTQRKTIAMLITMVIAYTLLTVPYVSVTLWDYLSDTPRPCDSHTSPGYSFKFFYYAAQTSTCVNVFILIVFNKSFRQELRSLVKCGLRMCSCGHYSGSMARLTNTSSVCYSNSVTKGTTADCGSVVTTSI